MKLHGEVYTFKLVLRGDMAFQGDYARKGMTKPITKSKGYAAMMPHVMGKDKEDRQDYQWAHFGQRHKYPPGFMCIEPKDMIGDTMHDGIQICPHVVWHTVHKRCKDKQTS
eukprot:jgi/Tetstr1/440508/TSEL_028831.t1